MRRSIYSTTSDIIGQERKSAHEGNKETSRRKVERKAGEGTEMTDPCHTISHLRIALIHALLKDLICGDVIVEDVRKNAPKDKKATSRQSMLSAKPRDRKRD